jgi:hypothetical protein
MPDNPRGVGGVPKRRSRIIPPDGEWRSPRSPQSPEPPLRQVVALMAAALAAFVGAVYYASVPCRPGDRGFYIGGVMLMAGCPKVR